MGVLALFAVGLRAQDSRLGEVQPEVSSTPQWEPFFVPLHTADEPGYGVWAAGDNYKAGFEGQFAFVPYLGADYAENQVFAWRTESVRVGGRPIGDDSGVPRQVDGRRFEYDFGAFVEAYDLALASVEQTFLIHARPAASGALEVCGRVTTPMTHVERARAHAPLRFCGPAGEVLVEYGAATAIDARGRRFPMTTAWDGERIRLGLDAASVASAEFPLLVDPVILTTSSARNVGETAICARDRDERWVAHTRLASSGDHDLYIMAFRAGWTNQTLVHNNVTLSNSTVHVSGARAQGRGMFAYERRYSNRSDIHVVRTDGKAVTIASVVGEYLCNPEIGGAIQIHGNLVAYDRVAVGTSTVRAGLASASTAPNLTWTPFAGSIATPGVAVEPDVGDAFIGASMNWVILWAEDNGTTSRVRAQAVRNNGTLEGSVVDLLTSTSRVYEDPRIMGTDGGPMMMTYHQLPRFIGTQAIRAVAVDNSSWPPTLGDDRSLHAGQRYQNVGLAYDVMTGSHWMASYQVFTGVLTQHIEFTRVGPKAVVAQRELTSSAGQPTGGGITFGAYAAAFPGQHGLYLASFGNRTTNNPELGEEIAYPAAAFQPLIGLGSPDCGGTDEIASVQSPMLVGHRRFEMELQEQTNLAALFIGVTPVSLPLDAIGMPGCVLGVDVLGTLPASGGTFPSLRWSVPDDAGLLGIRVLAQWVWSDPRLPPPGLVTSSVLGLSFR